jgi:poly-gamma-glutamate synthesis protein (capsule biosynthesis protein)
LLASAQVHIIEDTMTDQSPLRRLLLLLCVALIIGGVANALWTIGGVTSSASPADGLDPSTLATTALGEVQDAFDNDTAATDTDANGAGGDTGSSDAVPTEATPTEEAPKPLIPYQVADGVSTALVDALADLGERAGVNFVATAEQSPDLLFQLDLQRDGGEAIYQELFAVTSRFDTIEPSIRYTETKSLWRGGPVPLTGDESAPDDAVAGDERIAPGLVVLSDTLPALTSLLGPAGSSVWAVATITEVVDAVWANENTLAMVPFDQLQPRLAVFKVDGQTPVENAAHFDPAAYPLVVTNYVHYLNLEGPQAAFVTQLIDELPVGNRDAELVTVVAMTGVTAMCRQTAQQMDINGPAWPAEVVGPELASADITHISNEVPFTDPCETNTNPDNLNFCSKLEYYATLEASGTDIIGLTGNHQNDFGRAEARNSLAFYESKGLPVYGGGIDREAAYAPLYLERNGTRFAFLGANSYGPKFAWATDAEPGSAKFDLAVMSATIRAIKETGKADVVLVELQYQESYDPTPLIDQRNDFNALVRAGADIVTGVQSHVPQGMEFTDGRLILYGLGNLYFDQMWGQATREGMIVKHTFYDGRHISTQILTTLLYDYGQPRWTSPAERAAILNRVFASSYW